MGIFSLFGKKDNRQAKPADKESSRTKKQAGATSPSSPRTASSSSSRLPTVKRDAKTALATALKIDAIESEMSSEFVSITTQPPTTQQRKPPPAPPAKPKAAPPQDKPRAETRKLEPAIEEASLQTLTTGMGTTTDFLLAGQTAVVEMAAPASDAAAVIEEAAIMYANGQSDVVEQMLKTAIEEDLLGDLTRNAWWMLFDLYQITGKKQEFENLSIDFASKFETSPPGWIESGRDEAPAVQAASATPMVPFSGKLDGACIKQVERAQKLGENYRALRLEFAKVTEATTDGCKLLLGLFRKLQRTEHDLILVGAPELAAKIRAIISVGRREDTEESWLLLLEILRLLNQEKEFEETSIDYCVTFEVSPPAFVAPKSKITTASADTASAAKAAEGFAMPAVVEGKIDNLILAIAAYSDEHSPAIIDCSNLNRVDFNAAGRLLTGLGPFCGMGKTIEFHHVNHLVAELFGVIGLKDIARIVPRKN